ncbi:hypothetical protein ACVWW6_008770 [Bradyrhizobium sp. USDA 3311]
MPFAPVVEEAIIAPKPYSQYGSLRAGEHPQA